MRKFLWHIFKKKFNNRCNEKSILFFLEERITFIHGISNISKKIIHNQRVFLFYKILSKLLSNIFYLSWNAIQIYYTLNLILPHMQSLRKSTINLKWPNYNTTISRTMKQVICWSVMPEISKTHVDAHLCYRSRMIGLNYSHMPNFVVNWPPCS